MIENETIDQDAFKTTYFSLLLLWSRLYNFIGLRLISFSFYLEICVHNMNKQACNLDDKRSSTLPSEYKTVNSKINFTFYISNSDYCVSTIIYLN